MSSSWMSGEDSAPRAGFEAEGSAPEAKSIVGSETEKIRNRPAKKHHISKDDFYRETDDKTRGALAAAAASAIIEFLGRDRAVFIEHFGVVFPEIRSELKAHVDGQHLFLRNEKTRTANFEKTDDLTASHRECFPNIVETRELAAAAYAKLPIETQLSLNPAEIKRLLRGLFKAVRHEVVSKGFSPWLSPVGDFFAIHNRQGLSSADWFAGADIFIVPSSSQPIEVGQSKRMFRPTLESAHEIFDCSSGTPLMARTVRPVFELSELGLAAVEEGQRDNAEFEVRAYLHSESGDRSQIIYATNGIRTEKSQRGAVGSEFVLCLSVDSRSVVEQQLPKWPIKALSMAWALEAHMDADKPLKVGLGLSADAPIFTNKYGGEMRAIMISEFHLAALEQLSAEGAFRFFSVVPLLDDEARLAEERGSKHLLSILRHKGAAKFSQEHRDSLLA